MYRLVPAFLALLVVGHGALAHDKEIEGAEVGGIEAQPEAVCDAGAAQGFPCWNVDLLAWLPTGIFGAGHANDIWGWTDRRSGREYAMIGLRGGTAFVDVSDPAQPVYLGLLPTETLNSSWRDIKTYRDHAFIVSEAPGHGLQIFDLSALEGVVNPPVVFAPTLLYTGFGNSHNLALDEKTGIAYAVGTRTCAGGLHMVDVTRPQEPLFVGCFGDDGYTHDAQCVVYRGPDTDHTGREVCFNSNEDTLTVVDVTNKDAPRMLSRQGYAGSGYTHQGWLTDDHRYFLLGDELDELRNGHNVRTYVWDVADLEAPFVVGAYTGAQRSIGHNIAVIGNHVFEANYRSGLRVLRTGDLLGAELTEVAYFDTFPGRDGLAFSGAWGVYPFFESGVVVVSDINRGLFVLGPDLQAVPECSDGIDNDADGLTDHPEDPSCADAEGAAELPRNDVAIDVKPGNPHNFVNTFSPGVVPVAVLGSPSFDVTAVDPDTLRFGPGAAPAWPRRAIYRDVDADGDVDLFAWYGRRRSGLAQGAEKACLRWQTWDGTPYEGCDAIRTVRPDRDERKRRLLRWLLRFFRLGDRSHTSP
ncbi:MAG: choice-of-anchor B family protein [Myxococcales bacterium]|nr:choice-of-anchor B family protein [Myxococcales bacterium]